MWPAHPQSEAADDAGQPATPDEPIITFGVELEYFLTVPHAPLREFTKTPEQITADLDLSLQHEKAKLAQDVRAVAGDKELEALAIQESERVTDLLRKRSRALNSQLGRVAQYAAKILTSQPILTNGVHVCLEQDAVPDYSRWNFVKEISIQSGFDEVARLRRTSIEVASSSYAYQGMELVSPVFRVSEPSTWYPQLSFVQSAMKGMAYTNPTTGLHVHLGVENAPIPTQALRVLLLVWAAAEPAIESIHEQHRHGRNLIWAGSLLRSTREEMQSVAATHDSESPRDIEEAAPSRRELLEAFARKLHDAPPLAILRFCSQLNGCYTAKLDISLPKARDPTPAEVAAAIREMAPRDEAARPVTLKRFTVECREHGGSLDPEAIACWVRFCAHMLRFAMREAARPAEARSLTRILALTSTLEELFEAIGVAEEDRGYFERRRREVVEAEAAFEGCREEDPFATRPIGPV